MVEYELWVWKLVLGVGYESCGRGGGMVKGGLWFYETVGVNWRWDEGIHKPMRVSSHSLCVGRE
jgi:hypothetical protein